MRSAFWLGSLRKVCGLAIGLLVMPASWRYFNSSCSKSSGSMRGPCSITTTLKPARDSSRAMMPPEAPEPTMTKSTVSLVLYVLRSMEAAPSEGVGLGAGIGHEALIILVVIAEGRLPGMVVDHADQVPARIVVIAAIFGQGDEAEQGEPPHRGEEGRLVDLVQPGDLLRLGRLGEGLAGAIARCIGALEIHQTLPEGGQLGREETAERVVDEIEDAGV